jgi:hypothetical protein
MGGKHPWGQEPQITCTGKTSRVPEKPQQPFQLFPWQEDGILSVSSAEIARPILTVSHLCCPVSKKKTKTTQLAKKRRK